MCRPKVAKRPRDPQDDTERGSSSSAHPVVDEAELLKEHTGTGRITSSGITVHGTGTEFMTQLSPGDAIIITHPTSYAGNFVAVFCFMSLTFYGCVMPRRLQQETKVVRMVLSNVSMGVSSSFSTDLISTTAFK
jgi:hypothetical protein